jgi:hypothetical protein
MRPNYIPSYSPLQEHEAQHKYYRHIITIASHTAFFTYCAGCTTIHIIHNY